MNAPVPDAAKAAFAEANRRARAGDLAGARQLYQSLIDQPGLTVPCLHQLGLIAGLGGDHRRAAALLDQVRRLKPDQLDVYPALSAALERSGNAGAALSVLIDLGCQLDGAGKHQAAAQVFRQVLERHPLNYPAWANLGHCLVRLGRPTEAAPPLMQALRLCGRLEPSVAALVSELERHPLDLPLAATPLPASAPGGRIEMMEKVLTTLGKVLSDTGHLDEAILCHRQAVALAPGYALGHWNLSLALLAKDDWQQGWREYEWRWHWRDSPEPRRRLPVPSWQGEPLDGKRILVWTEQGLGDAIQFVPLITRLQALGAEVVLETPSVLKRLFAQSLENITVVNRPDHPDVLSTDLPLDFVIPLMSLPQRLGLAITDLPLATHYLHAEPEVEAAWVKRLADAPHPKVGLVWSGRTNVIPFQVAKLALAVKDVHWYSLQLGPAQKELAAAGLEDVTDLSAELKDFADTAAAIIQLDLVVTIDTSVAHLAGAMNTPVWVLVDHLPNWRWTGDTDTSPWYPSMRLFRRGHGEAWDAVMARVVDALGAWVKDSAFRGRRAYAEHG